MRELESERENKENEPARRSLQFGGGGDGVRAAQLRPCDTNVGIGASGKRLRSAGDEEEIDDLWGEGPSPSKLLSGKTSPRLGTYA